jgi:hypothetical protein
MKYYVYGLYKKNIKYTTGYLSENLFYIGITSDKNLYFREKNHRREKSNPYKLNIINKYDFFIKILWTVETEHEAKEREAFLIRWFKKISEDGILVNVLESYKDTNYTRSFQSDKTKKRISKALKKANENKNLRIANRDRNLTVPYEKVIDLIEEWAKNPLETQQNFVDRKGLSRSKFKDWIRLYRPEYIGLTKKKQKEIFESIIDKDKKTPKEIIKEFSEKSGLNYTKSKGIYYRLI